MSTEFTHLDESGAARMVDVSAKAVTARTATARGLVRLSSRCVAALRAGDVPKGDALAVARIAGIQGAKRTPDLVPLCHPIALHGVAVDLTVVDDGVEIAAVARTADRTGVEMEALTAVSAAALALIDMVKAIDPEATIERVRLEEKAGGKSGVWRRGQGTRPVQDARADQDRRPDREGRSDRDGASDRDSGSEREGGSGQDTRSGQETRPGAGKAARP